MEMIKNGPSTQTAEPAAPLTKAPIGCVERHLNMRDRLLIHAACQVHVVRDGKSDYTRMAKIESIKEAIAWEDIQEYFDAINENYGDQVLEWTRATNYYRGWMAVSGGAMEEKDFLKRFPTGDLKVEPTKPTYREPTPSKEENRGPIKTFHFPSKLDVFIEQAFKAMNWNTKDSKYVTEFAVKYGFPIEERA